LQCAAVCCRMLQCVAARVHMNDTPCHGISIDRTLVALHPDMTHLYVDVTHSYVDMPRHQYPMSHGCTEMIHVYICMSHVTNMNETRLHMQLF